MKKITSFFVLLTFVISCVMPPQGFAQAASQMPWMPEPGTQVPLSDIFTPAYLKGMRIDPNDPFKFDFIVYRGDNALLQDQKQQEYQKLIKFFLAALAVPDTDQWVNLSPYEKDRIIPDNFGLTEMGRDLLAQDYLLKQISATLTDPDTNLGKKFWDGVYAQAYQKLGTTNIPTDVFNKVWITPDKAAVYEKDQSVYVVENHLRVQMESDYLAQSKNVSADQAADTEAMRISKQVMREVILPAIEKEVNEGKNFAPLRQVYSGMLLATWYKRTLKASILGKLYADRGKVKGVDQDPKNNEQIYQQYVQAFQKGVYNMIKEDTDRYSQEVIPRKYFSGGTKGYDDAEIVKVDAAQGARDFAEKKNNFDTVSAIFKNVRESLFGPGKQAVQNAKVMARYFELKALIKEYDGIIGHLTTGNGSEEIKRKILDKPEMTLSDYEAQRTRYLEEFRQIDLGAGTKPQGMDRAEKTGRVMGYTSRAFLKVVGGVKRLMALPPPTAIFQVIENVTGDQEAPSDIIDKNKNGDSAQKDLAEEYLRIVNEFNKKIYDLKVAKSGLDLANKYRTDVFYDLRIQRKLGPILRFLNDLTVPDSFLKGSGLAGPVLDQNKLKTKENVKADVLDAVKLAFFRMFIARALDTTTEASGMIPINEIRGRLPGFSQPALIDPTTELPVQDVGWQLMMAIVNDVKPGSNLPYGFILQKDKEFEAQIDPAEVVKADVNAAPDVLQDVLEDVNKTMADVAKLAGDDRSVLAGGLEAMYYLMDSSRKDHDEALKKLRDIIAIVPPRLMGRVAKYMHENDDPNVSHSLEMLERKEFTLQERLEQIRGEARAVLVSAGFDATVAEGLRQVVTDLYTVQVPQMSDQDDLVVAAAALLVADDVAGKIEERRHYFWYFPMAAAFAGLPLGTVGNMYFSHAFRNGPSVGVQLHDFVLHDPTFAIMAGFSVAAALQSIAGLVVLWRFSAFRNAFRKALETPVDQAEKMIDNAPLNRNGGIDLAQSNLDMQIRRDGNGMLLPLSQQNLENIHIDGLVPVILDIQPVTDMALFN